MENERAPPLLAIVRIVSVLGMSVAIALGIFLLLWGKIPLGFLAILASVPFFVTMRFMEKRALRE